jgi:hypothetical protein
MVENESQERLDVQEGQSLPFDQSTDEDKGGRQPLRGQSLVIVAILLILLVGMLALSIDGGNWYWNRRKAQNAADAGALAGAREYCTTGDATQALNRAQEYTLTRNGANTANIIVNSGIVTVTANIQFNNFFASVLGRPQGGVSATAAAGCFPPCGGTGVLPIAWSCRPPIAGFTDPSLDCSVLFGDGVPPDPLYIIMDSQSLSQDFYCQDPPNSGTPSTALDCDLNDDGVDEVLAGGNRSWLDLDGGGGGASSLSSWIQNGFNGNLNFPVWVAGQAGVANSVFTTVENYVEGQTVLIPVFDRYCDGRPDIYGTACPGQWNGPYVTGAPSPGDSIIPTGGTWNTYFRLVSFSLFHITCVNNTGGDHCPGHDNLVTALNLGNNLKTIEGYFTEGFDPDVFGGSCGGVDVGVHILNLTR